MARFAKVILEFPVWRLGLTAALILVLAGTPAQAQDESQSTTAELESLVDTLEDDESRAAFLENLRTLIEAERAVEGEPGERTGLLGRVSGTFKRLGQEFTSLVRDVGGWSDVAAWLGAELRDPDRRAIWLVALAKVAVVVGVALAAYLLAQRALAAPSRALFGHWGDGLVTRVLIVVGRAMIEVLPAVAFAAAAYALLAVVDPLDETRIVALALVNATLVVQLVTAVSNAVLAPLATGARPLPMSDETAAYLHVWIRRLVRIGAYGGFASQALSLLGVPPVGAGLVLRIAGLVFAILAIVLVLQNRALVAEYLRRDDSGDGGHVLRLVLGRLADVWHVLAIVAVGLAFGAWAIEAENTLGTITQGVIGTTIVVVVGKLALFAGQVGLDRLLQVIDDIAERAPGVELRANWYLPVLRFGLTGAVLFAMAVTIAEAWDLDAVAWLTSPWARDVLGRVVTIVGIGVLALLVIEVTDGIVTRFLEARNAAGQAVVRSARLRTLLPLARNTILIFVITIAVFTTLAELGVDIAPMLAGAGVIGLAIGFGAQALVKDVITGAFILFENQIAIGDVVDLGGTSGVVESMTIRTVTLRDVSGNVHTIPYGNVTMVTNMTRDFAFAVLDVGVGYQDDTDRIATVLQALDRDLRREPDVAAAVLEPIEIHGVTALAVSSVTMRARVKTRAGLQWTIQRRYLAAIKKAFEREGIDRPLPQRIVTVRQVGAPTDTELGALDGA
ncbi:MAG: mechanosensitive ion channel [Alphaproteobacteria bacterium]|nr:mechanosensitive ion channel [Alphaproteobacteria bacterium]